MIPVRVVVHVEAIVIIRGGFHLIEARHPEKNCDQKNEDEAADEDVAQSFFLSVDNKQLLSGSDSIKIHILIKTFCIKMLREN
jgi:hypothetical protein